jgi:hypothetical protein
MGDNSIKKKLIFSNYSNHKKIKELSDNKYLNSINMRNNKDIGYIKTISSVDYNDIYSTGVTLSTQNKNNHTIEYDKINLFDTYDYSKDHTKNPSKFILKNINKEQLVKEQNKNKIIKRRLIKTKLHKILNNNYHPLCNDFINKSIEKDIGISEVLKSNYYINKQAHSNLEYSLFKPSLFLIDSVESYLQNHSNSTNELFGEKLSSLLLHNFNEEDLQIIREDYKYFFPKNISVKLNSHNKQLSLIEKLRIEENKSNIDLLIKNKHDSQLRLLKQLSKKTVEKQIKEIKDFDKAEKYDIDKQENIIHQMFDKTKNYIKQNYNLFKIKSDALTNHIKDNKKQLSSRIDAFNKLKNKILIEKPKLILRKPSLKKTEKNTQSIYERLERVKISNLRVENFRVINCNRKDDEEQFYIQCLKNQETIKNNYSKIIK